MDERQKVTIDGNEATAYVAHKVNEVCAIYPITPSSPMGELADAYSAKGQENIWGQVPTISELQSEGGASGAVHGSLQGGALTTTFTASQGLLLMIPNMYKIAGELTPTVFHVSARSLSAQALSIFGDHNDVMTVRPTGFALLASGSIQEAHDNALIAQAATLESRVPFLHFFDGFRTSHEINKIEQLTKDDMRKMIDDEHVIAHRKRALNPENPVLRGTSQNPDVYFQGRETVNPYYEKTPEIVKKAMKKFAEITGRKYNLFDYVGHPEAERIIIIMGTGAEVTHEAVNYLVKNESEKVGLIKVRLYRPFSIKHFVEALPRTTKAIAVMDRTKEVGAPGEPMYLDVVNALRETEDEGYFKTQPKVVGGRYGLSSKEYTPAMIKAIFDELKKDKPNNHFTIGINDDVSKTSLDYDPDYTTEGEKTIRCLFYGLGGDGTVSANKSSIKIIGEETDNHAQGYFVYDSKKSGAMTVSHLRFGPEVIRSSYLIKKANFIQVSQFIFLEKLNILKNAVEGATLLLNTPYPKDKVWDELPKTVQEEIIKKKIKVYAINAYAVAEDIGLGERINTILQTCFFAISNILKRDEAIKKIKEFIEKSYKKKGEEILKMNYRAVDQAIENMYEVEYPDKATSTKEMMKIVPDYAPKFVKEVTAKIMAGEGDDLPVSKMPADGTFPTGTTKYEKRNIALKVPVWEPDLCVQCGMCSIFCPHGVIRSKVYDKKYLEDAPKTFKHAELNKGTAKDFDSDKMVFTLQIAVEDCTGCAVCVTNCPAKDKQNPKKKAINMEPQIPLRETESENWDYFLSIPDPDRTKVRPHTVKGSQLLLPLFEFSGACAGCGETPYVKLMTQLFGDRALIANATGCSSIYGGNLPTTPYTKNHDGRGPAWNNSLFEDNAEFGYGMRLSVDQHKAGATTLLKKLATQVGEKLADEIIHAKQKTETDIDNQRKRVAELKEKLKGKKDQDSQLLMSLADYLVKKSVWILGGDGWAYDIGYGGLDHVLASDRDINVLVLDTEVYSNTGGQMSKATGRGSVAKFAYAGKPLPKKDLAMIAVTYGHIYVASIAMGSNSVQTTKAFVEAEAYDGPSLIIAYSHCISHGFNMQFGMQQQKLAVKSGYWPLFRYNPDLKKEGKNPFQLESKGPQIPLKDYLYNEQRYKSLLTEMPETAVELLKLAEKDVQDKWKIYNEYAKMDYSEYAQE